MDVVDLSLPLYPGMPGYPGDPPVTFTSARRHDTDGYQVTQFSLGSHAGTHLDAPRHLFADGPTLDQIPVGRLVGPGVVLDCRPAVPPTSADRVAQTGGISPVATINAALLAERLRLYSIPSGALVLLWTAGALLTTDAAHLLLPISPSLVGTDAPSLDTDPYPVHRLFLERGILLAENLCGLERLGSGLVTCAFLPLSVAGTDGAPVRAVAWR